MYEDYSGSDKNSPLQPETILLIFLFCAIQQIFLISIAVLVIRRIKLIAKSVAKKYYFFVCMYLLSKMGLFIFMEVKIIQGV